MSVATITVGVGRTVPEGRRVTVNGVAEVARAISAASGHVEDWWSPHTFANDYRDGDNWEASIAVGIDLDTEKHVDIAPELALHLENLARSSGLSGSIFHTTPAGARVVFVFAEECRDRGTAIAAAQAAAARVRADMRELGLDEQGLSIDDKVHADLARFYFTPNTFAKGKRRSAQTITMRSEPFDAAALATEWTLEQAKRTPAATERPLSIVRNGSDRATPEGRARAYIRAIPAAAQGNRDNTGFVVAANLRNDFALPDSLAEEIFKEWCASCSPPLGERDVARIFKSAGKNGKHAAGAKLLEDRPFHRNGVKGGGTSGAPVDAVPVTRGPVSDDAAGPEPTPPPGLAEEPARGIPLIRACDAVEKPVEWLVEPFLARGELTDLSGDPGVGKGGITASWAAAVTKADPAATVVMLATEDPLGRVKARLRAEGADLERVWFLDINQPNASPILPGDIAAVEAIVTDKRVALLVLDPALEFMQADLDSHKQQDVAAFMRPLLGVALRTGVTILTVRHNNKNAGASALHRAAGSIAFTGTARIALTAAKNQETGARALAVTKNNLSGDKHTVGYEIVARDGASVITWGEVLEVTADELVNQEPGKSRRGPPPAKLEAAKDLIRDILSGGPMQVDDVLRCAKSAGVSRTFAYEAKDALGVEKVTLKMKAAWRLPENETPDGHPVKLRTTPDNSGQGDES